MKVPEVKKLNDVKVDVLGEEVNQNYDISKIRVNKSFHFVLRNPKLIDNLLSKGWWLQRDLHDDIVRIIKDFWTRRIAEFKVNHLPESELAERISKIADTAGEKSKDVIIGQFQTMENTSQRSQKILDFFNNLKVIFSVDPKIMPVLQLSDLKAKHIGQFVHFDCTIIGMEDEQVIPTDVITEKEPTRRIPLPLYEQRKSEFGAIKEVIYKDSQFYMVEEIGKYHIKKKHLRKLPIQLFDNFVGTLQIGDKIRVLGTYAIQNDARGVKREKDVTVFGFNVELLEAEKEVKLSEERLQQMKADLAADQEQFINDFTISFASHITENKTPKLGIILACIGPSELGPYRMPIMIYLVGNPGTGKSELLKEVPKIRYKTAYTDAPSASVRGLTYGQDEYKGHKILKAGLMVNHEGLCLDEFDKMGDSRQELNTTLEQQQASYHRNPFDIDTPIDLFVIAAGNPKNSKWVEGRTLLEQLSPIEPEILSRFFIIKVNPAKNRSERLKHIFKNIKDEQTAKPKYTEEDIAGWISYARKRNPELTAESEHEIIQFAEFFAGLEQPEEVNIDFGARQELDIIRVSSAIAKFLDKKSVDVECVRLAIKFIKDCMQSLGLRTESPNIQSDLYGLPVKPSDAFDKIVRELEKSSPDGCFSEAELLSEMVKTAHWKTNEAAHGYWNRHNPNVNTKSSQFYEPHPGRYKRV